MAQYQVYLEEVRAAHLADMADKVRRKARMQKIESYRERQSHGNSDQDPDAEEEKNSEADDGPPEESEGFGIHYA
jgi:hypothetical protein